MSYRTTTKKNLIIFHNPEEWLTVLVRLEKDFGQTIRMRHIMRRELGFTARDHRGLEPNTPLTLNLTNVVRDKGYHYDQQVHLDFYNESSRSWFILKYL